MDVVLDKSYLQGASSEEVKQLCASHRVIMSESLFYELLTTEPQVRARCFRKIPDTENPLMLIPNVGPLLRWEIEHGQPCRDLMAVALKGRYMFNTGLRKTDFQFGERQAAALREWRSSVAEDVKQFKATSAIVSGWFPNLKGYKPGGSASVIAAARARISNDSELIRQIYSDIRHSTFPEKDRLTEDWVLYRWVQIHVLAALDYVKKYGDGNLQMVAKAIENEYIDLEYCITATAVGALASRDSGMIARFKSIKPDGNIVS